MNRPVNVTVTGGAGGIGYATVFRLAAGAMLGANTKVNLRLLEIPAALGAAEAVAMELQDCAFPLLANIEVTDCLKTAFDGTEVALLIGARPRSKGMERADLLEANAAIFKAQGKAINDHGAQNIRVLVVGNPANTNALIAAAHAPDVPLARFNAMMRLDGHRACGMLAAKAGVPITAVAGVTVWGNHSANLYPDIDHATIAGRAARAVIGDDQWVANQFIPDVQQRGAAIIAARGQSSTASAGHAAISHVREWILGSEGGNWASVGMPSDGSYGIPEGIICGFPALSVNGEWQIIPGLEISEFSRKRIDVSVAELVSERETVKSLGLI